MTKMRLLYNFSTFQGTTQPKRTFSDGTKRIGARDGEHNAHMPRLIIHRRKIVVFATWDKERVSHGLSHRARHKKKHKGVLDSDTDRDPVTLSRIFVEHVFCIFV